MNRNDSMLPNFVDTIPVVHETMAVQHDEHRDACQRGTRVVEWIVAVTFVTVCAWAALYAGDNPDPQPAQHAASAPCKQGHAMPNDCLGVRK